MDDPSDNRVLADEKQNIGKPSIPEPANVNRVAGDEKLGVETTDSRPTSEFLSAPTAGPEEKLSSTGTSVLDEEDSAEKGALPVEAQKPPRNVNGVVWGLVVLSILSSTFLFALDNTIVADVQPAIVERFGAISKLPWLSVAFLLGASSTNLIWGKVYAQFDAKYLYLLTVLLFEAGSAICGAANSMDVLIFGRALCGVGGAGMYCGVMTLLSVTTTEHERPMYIGLTGVTWGLGTVLGPIIGGAFTDSNATWRWAFYINLCVGGAFAPVYIFLLPRFDPRSGVTIRRRFAELDYVGTILIIGAMTSGVMAISFGGIVYPWNSGRIIGLFVTSGVLFILFGTQQTYTIFTTKARRIFPIDFLKSRTMLILFASVAAAASITFIPIYYIPLFFQFVHNDSALEAGVRLLPYVCFLVFMCVANGGVMSATGWYFPWYLGGGIFSVIGGALMFTVNMDSSTSRIYGYSILLAIGAGAFIQASYSVAQSKVKPEDIPLSIGFITAGQVGGGTIALAIANSVFLNQSANEISKILPDVPKTTIQATISGAGSSFFNSLDAKTKAQVLQAIVGSLDKAYILAITGGALVTVLSLLLKKEKLFMKAGGAG